MVKETESVESLSESEGSSELAEQSMAVLSSGAEALGITLHTLQLDQFQRYYAELVDWNARVNLTGITRWHDVVTKHYLDSLSVSMVIPAKSLQSGRFADVGSGAGFPGLPLKIAFPHISLTLIDATGKKTAFLSHLVEVLELTGVDVRTGRAEILGHESELRETFDVVTARGVAKLPVMAEFTAPFCRIGGLVVAQKGRDVAEELQGAQAAIDTLGMIVNDTKGVSIKELTQQRTLVVLKKVRQTPDRYPRCTGIPAKRPL